LFGWRKETPLSLPGSLGTAGDRTRQGQHAALAITRAPSQWSRRTRWSRQMPLAICFCEIDPVAHAALSWLIFALNDQQAGGQGIYDSFTLIHPYFRQVWERRRGKGQHMCIQHSACGASSHQRTLGLFKTRGSSISWIPQTLDISRFSAIIFRCFPQ
jgi:hypothetical protein